MPTVFVPRETRPGEARVAATPETVKRLVAAGAEVAVEAGAGLAAYFSDAAYEAAGARLERGGAGVWRRADAVLKVAPPTAEEAGALRAGAVLVGFLAPYRERESVRRLAEAGVSALAMELVPRITRAQPMDALSSQASIGGYKAALLAAVRLPRYFPLLMTAAGTIPPARVVVMGAGVAGLQAIATARRLGAVVEVSDVRAAVKEQVESLGGRFIEVPQAESGEGAGGYAREMGEDFLARQRQAVGERVAAADAVITTALVPGRPAPRLVSAAMIEAMRPGSVVVDLAVEAGGNCELSQADREVVHGGVLVLAPSNLPATVPHHASTLYARNVQALLQLLLRDRRLAVDPSDEVVAGCLLTHRGELRHELP
ncbi:MAG TPA: Re/Si-specific NAD(P)(+) transhydrogenase subunit alpha [Thermoanaerobaculia bacterium]|nr:Re/Si-specific NAD(P)(+) transhydrogenase subunit alpha [Thermoanaerobaculia bacterium]